MMKTILKRFSPVYIYLAAVSSVAMTEAAASSPVVMTVEVMMRSVTIVAIVWTTPAVVTHLCNGETLKTLFLSHNFVFTLR